MDLMNAMVLPATSEPARNRRSDRPRQEEEPMVSFPTMLERNARLEKETGSSRAVSSPERSREKVPAPEKQEESPVADTSTHQKDRVPGSEDSPVQGDKQETTATGTATQTGPAQPQATLAAEEEPGLDPALTTSETATATGDPAGPAGTIGLEEVPEEALTKGAQAVPTTSTQPASASQPGLKTEAQDPSRVAKEETPSAIPTSRPEVPTAEADTVEIVSDETAEPETVEAADIATEMDTPDLESAPAEGIEVVEMKIVQAEAAAQGADVKAEEAMVEETETEPVSPLAEDAQQSLKLQHARQKYEQPQIASATTESKVTLADLDLDSGGLDTFLSRDSLAAALKHSAFKGSGLQQHIRAQVSQQVVEHLRSEMAGEKLTLRLNPEELGQVEIHFHALNDKLSISLSAENKQAETALKDGTRELADSIGEKSSRFNMVEVRVETRSQQDQGKNEARQDDQRKERDPEQQSSQNQEQPGHRQHQAAPHQTGASEWAAFHLGGQ